MPTIDRSKPSTTRRPMASPRPQPSSPPRPGTSSTCAPRDRHGRRSVNFNEKPDHRQTASADAAAEDHHHHHHHHDHNHVARHLRQPYCPQNKRPSFEDAGGIQGGRMNLQPLFLGVSSWLLPDGAPGSGGAGGEGRRAGQRRGKGANNVLHRGLVITEAVRAELSNPMSHRFKLLRGAH